MNNNILTTAIQTILFRTIDTTSQKWFKTYFKCFNSPHFRFRSASVSRGSTPENDSASKRTRTSSPSVVAVSTSTDSTFVVPTLTLTDSTSTFVVPTSLADASPMKSEEPLSESVKVEVKEAEKVAVKDGQKSKDKGKKKWILLHTYSAIYITVLFLTSW